LVISQIWIVASVTQKILVVDDEVGALTLIGIMLERGGFEVQKASDAYAALEILRTTIPDMIILDVMMPGMDGIELCRHIRGASGTSSTPVLILSARGDADAVQQGLDAGADSYLSKPILHHDLITKVRELLRLD
jgi:two-component system response regulator MtrA